MHGETVKFYGRTMFVMLMWC